MHGKYFNVSTAKLNEAGTQRIAGHSAMSGPQQQPFRNCVRESRLPKTFSQLVPQRHLRLQMRHYEEQAQEGSTASAEDSSSADASSSSSGCTQQASGSRQRRQQRLCSRRLAALLAAAMLISRSEALLLGGNVQTYESQEHSILARAKDLVTEAVQDAANAVGPASKRWTRQEKHTLQLKETQVNLHVSKKGGHGGIPSWFTGRAGAEHKQQSAQSVLESNRRMLRRQKQHHHSIEDEWLKCHRRYVEELEGNEASTSGWDVLFYGDSIMEEWRGTFLGSAWGPFQDVKRVWAEFFEGKPHKSHAFGIAGDKTEQLLWRLQNGELPATKHPKVVVVMIGTNDLVGDMCTAKSAQETARSIMEINSLLHAELPATHILSLAVLPKGEVWPNRCSEAILTVNAELQEYANLNPEFAHFLDVGPAFLSDETVGGHYEIRETLMPDSLHPSAVGMRIVASQLEPVISNLVNTPISADVETS